MKLRNQIILLAAGTAVLSSAVTSLALQKNNAADSAIFSSAVTDTGAAAGYYRVNSPIEESKADFTTAAENTINGVVSIKSFVTNQYQQPSQGGFFTDPLFEYFFGSPGRGQQQPNQQPQPREQQSGLGSGVIISADGYIVTNNHVIDKAERLEVTLNDNRTFDATVVGSDASTDLALIKIDATDLPVIPIGDSEALKVGEWVLAVGNPFGFTSTVTTGIVSAKARSITGVTHSRPMGIESYIQTDAAVNPGNSGGALVNLQGQLIGINTAIYSQTGNYAGYSFAIPTSIVKKVVSDIRQFGAVQRAVLGVSILDLNNELARENDITLVSKGVFVGEVADRSSALEAGIKKGDVIVKVNDAPTDNVAQLQEQVAKYRPGDTVKVTYVRDNKFHTVDVKLLNTQGTTKVTKPETIASLGGEFAPVSEELRIKLGISGGVQVKAVTDGRLSEAGVSKDYIIISINNIKVSSPADVEKIYKRIIKSDDDEKLLILRGLYPSGRSKAYLVNLSDD